jgi:hypothetical protein
MVTFSNRHKGRESIMAEFDPNPYAPPVHESAATHALTRWRILPAAVSFLIGLASFAFGMFAVAVMTYVVATQGPRETLGGMLAACTCYLGFGAAWVAAGWFYWRCRFRDALLANIVGISIPVVCVAILGV